MTGEMCRAVQIPTKAVTSSKIITWFQSQVMSSTSRTQCLVMSESPPFILAGDYFTSSTFTGCVQSATAAATAAAKLLGGERTAQQGKGGYASISKPPQAGESQGAQ